MDCTPKGGGCCYWVPKWKRPRISGVRMAHLSVILFRVAATTGTTSKGSGRHRCTPADGGGTHFAGVPGRAAFIQQVLHAVNLMARDRTAWEQRAWLQARVADPEFAKNQCF